MSTEPTRYALDAIDIWHAIKETAPLVKPRGFVNVLGFCNHMFLPVRVAPAGEVPELRFICGGCRGKLERKR